MDCFKVVKWNNELGWISANALYMRPQLGSTLIYLPGQRTVPAIQFSMLFVFTDMDSVGAYAKQVAEFGNIANVFRCETSHVIPCSFKVPTDDWLYGAWWGRPDWNEERRLRSDNWWMEAPKGTMLAPYVDVKEAIEWAK